MKNLPCPYCSRPAPAPIIPDGIWFAPFSTTPLSVSYRCECGTNRSLPWASATHAQRVEAGLAQLARDRESEMEAR